MNHLSMGRGKPCRALNQPNLRLGVVNTGVYVRIIPLCIYKREGEQVSWEDDKLIRHSDSNGSHQVPVSILICLISILICSSFSITH